MGGLKKINVDINNPTGRTAASLRARSVRPKVVHHAVALTSVEEEEVAVRGVSLRQSLQTHREEKITFHSCSFAVIRRGTAVCEMLPPFTETSLQ